MPHDIYPKIETLGSERMVSSVGLNEGLRQQLYPYRARRGRGLWIYFAAALVDRTSFYVLLDLALGGRSLEAVQRSISGRDEEKEEEETQPAHQNAIAFMIICPHRIRTRSWIVVHLCSTSVRILSSPTNFYEGEQTFRYIKLSLSTTLQRVVFN